MIIIEEVLTNPSVGNRTKDIFEIEWYETTKTIIRRPTQSGMELVIRKNSRVPLADGDILWMDDERYVVLVIKSCECIVFTPNTLKEMGIICFEIGNKHIPIYIDDENNISVAYESPLYVQLQRAGYAPRIEERKLLQTHMLRANGHGNTTNY
ncbi:urease accessory protein UreE [Chitinophaga qingshengii]|uniref:Urease accessory protein UreE n=1 Tax=Chitinophaga qingshengii TaxID=1569794 RepID=A0ABR7TU20_9BACT|nr:urease accessory protein UreE [Chitinophaga qingshengii]MBC9933513.1 urease accessory protein UreE [Chitinophaga qingshengii]